jgi:hypothetical protein
VDQQTSAKESIDNKQQSTDFEDDRHYLHGLMMGGRQSPEHINTMKV